jgi:hypothetical protein
MRKLKKGIRLHSSLDDGFARVFINSGTMPYKEQQLQRVRFADLDFVPLFHDNAYVPKHDWRKLTENELSCIRRNPVKHHNSISIGDTNEEIKDLFRSLEITEAQSREDVMERIKERPLLIKTMSESMQRFLLPMSGNKPFAFNCIAANLPNLELVACDISKLPPRFTIPERKYEGLHNDGTGSMKIHTNHRVGNRITINLGKEARIFYFINLTLIQAFNMISERLLGAGSEKITVYNIGKYFFKYFPNYPVIKVVQRPYEYYIAPTDNCFHDGSTLGSSSLDINIVYFGYFTAC